MSGEKHDARQWFLRTGDKTFFGPVPMRSLIVWAEQGRILPGHEVSCDRKTWLSSEQVPELDISWYVDDGSGNLRGPLNRIAAEQILKSDKAPAGARLVDAKSADPARVVRPAEPVLTLDAPPPPARREAAGRARAENRPDASVRENEERDSRVVLKLKQTIERLERELANARDLPLLGIAPPASAVADDAKEKESQAAYRKQLDERQEQLVQCQKQLAESQERLAERQEQLVQCQKQLAESQERLAERGREVARLKAAEAELLAFANARDAESRARVGELENQLTAALSARTDVPVRAPEHDDILRQALTEEIEALDKDLVRERESFAAFRDLSNQRQEALQERMRELTRQLRGDAPGTGSRLIRDSTRNPETCRLLAELEALRSTHENEIRQAAERESELLGRLRDMGQEQKHRALEREQFQANEQALLRRIEELERKNGCSTPATEPGVDPETPAPDNRPVRSMPWLRLGK